MNETIGQGAGWPPCPTKNRRDPEHGIPALPATLRTLMAIAAAVVVPLALLQYGIGHWFRTNGQQLQDQAVASTSFWAVASASLLAALVELLLHQVRTGAIIRTIATEVAGHDLGLDWRAALPGPPRPQGTPRPRHPQGQPGGLDSLTGSRP